MKRIISPIVASLLMIAMLLSSTSSMMVSAKEISDNYVLDEVESNVSSDKDIGVEYDFTDKSYDETINTASSEVLSVSALQQISEEDIITDSNTGFKYVVLEDGTAQIVGFVGSTTNGFNIPEKVDNITVTIIGKSAFSGREDIAGELFLPDTIEYIGDSAFYGCKNLIGNLVLPNSLKQIGEMEIPESNLKYGGFDYTQHGAFQECTGLVGKVVIPSSVSVIGCAAFKRCNGVTEVEIEEGNATNEVKIGTSAFYECENLARFILSSNVVEIDAGVFGYCTNLSSLDLPHGIRIIGRGFINGTKIEEIFIPNTVVEIKNGESGKAQGASWTSSGIASYGSNLQSIVFEDGIKKIPDYMLAENYSGYADKCVTSITIPDSVEEIGIEAFSGCDKLETVTLSSSLKRIDYGAFTNCYNLTYIDLPEGLEYIGGDAFGGGSLKKIILPSTLKTIDVGKTMGPFESGVGLKMVAFLGDCPDYINNNQYHPTVFGDYSGMIYYPKEGSGWTTTIMDKMAPSAEWKSYAKGEKPWEINIDLDIPLIISTFSTSETIKFDDGYIPDHFSFNVNMYAIASDSESDGYSNVKMTLQLPQGLSFSENEISKSYYKPIGNMLLSDANLREISFSVPVYIFENEKQNSFIINAAISADGYSEEQVTNYSISVEEKEEEDLILDDSSDKAIVEEVKKYTDNSDYMIFETIMQSNRSEEEKFRLLNELFHNRGITDPGEGVKYLSDVSSHRRDYLYLTTNENYCAFNWWYWLNDTTKGKIARGLLYSDGLIFDNELTSYIDWSTYANSSYPGVEKCKTMLKDFMLPDSDDAPVSEVASNSKKTLKAIKNAVKLNDMVADASLEEIMNHVVNAKTQKELEKYQNQFANWMIQQTKVQQEITINGETKLYLGTEGISKCLGYSASIISFSASTTQDIVDILNLEDNIQHYMEYDNFLKSVYSDEDVSKEMRIAAYQLHDDIENGYFNEIRSILSNFIDMGVSLIYLDKGLLETYLQTHGISTVGVGLLGEALGTLTLGTVISNIIIDAGDFTKQAAYTEAYAELSTLYSFKLQDDKTNFLANPTTDNAWKFYEDYNLLWRLRYKGEQQYLRMHEIKAFIFGKIKACGYETKASVVQDILDILSNNKFEMADSITVPESISYVKKMVIDCPVDVTVKTKSGTVIAVLKDGELSDITNEYGRFAVVYQSYSDEYAKVICQLTNDDLDIDVSATNAGIVSYHSASAASDEYYSFSNIHVETGDMIKVKETSYQITSIDGDEAEKVELTKNDDTYVKPSSIALSKDSLSLIVGDNEVADVSILPATATNKDVIWYSEDDSIATVKNGLIHALAVGDTTIWVRACDGDELEKSISIHVEDSAYTYMITATAGAGGTITPSGTKDVAKGSSQTYTITANTGYSIEDVKVDGVSQGGIDTYTFSNVQEAHTIGATFKSVDSPEEGSFSVGFSNVSTDQYLGLRFNSDNSHYETVYTGTVIKPEIAVTGLNGVLIEGVDYTVKYSNNLNYNSKGKPAIITVTGKGNYAGKKELNFYILQTDLSVAKEKGLLTLEDEYKIQSGRKVSPIITYGDYTLKAADMNISNKSAIKADTTISVSGKGNFTGTLEGIAVKVLSAAEIKSSTIKVTLKPTTHIYNGNSHVLTYSTSATKGELTVTAGSSTIPLTEGTDYTVTYKNNTNAGNATVKIKGIGSYIGNVTKTFKIQPDKTSSMTATLKDSNAIIYYSSSGVNPEVVVTVTRSAGDSETLTAGKDYKVSYSNNKKVGNGKYSITFIGNYKGQKAIKNKTFTITAAPFNGAVASSPDKVYSKAGKYLSAPYVSIDGIQLTSKDYNVKYFDGGKEITSKTKVSLDSDVQSKKITVKITGKGNYQTQEITTTYQILKASATTIDLSKAKIVANAKNAKGKDVAVGKQEYSGAEIKPDIRVLFKIGKTWTEVPASTYSVTYINNIRKGTATILITGDGTNSVGSLTTKFTIGSKSLGLFQWLFGN